VTEYEYAPATRRLDKPNSDWELVPSGGRKVTVYATEAIAKGRLTHAKGRHEGDLAWAKERGHLNAMRYHDREYTILRRPIGVWQEYDWQRKS
jgi:hypothetical protein